jgi:hypothetical protein
MTGQTVCREFARRALPGVVEENAEVEKVEPHT